MARVQVKGMTIAPEKGVPLPFSHIVAFWSVAGLLFFTPFFRGLFFPMEQERALIVAALSFWLVYFGQWVRQRPKLNEHALDWMVLCLPAVYVISSLVAVNQGLAVNEIVKTALYFTVFWTVSRLVTGEEVVCRLLTVIWASGIFVSLAGLATATGIIFIRDGFMGGRIYSSFQYPNALANYLLCVLVLGVYLWFRALGRGTGNLNQIWPVMPSWLNRLSLVSYLYTAGNYFITVVFWGAKSNGGILTLAVISPLLLLGAPKGKRVPLFLHALAVGIPGLLVVLKFINEASANRYDLAWLWVFLGLVVVVGLQALYDLLLKEKIKIKLKVPTWVFGAGIGAVAAAGAGVLALRPDLLQRFLTLIHFRNATERLHFYRDALEMIAARPLLGWGGGGWQEAYRAFQHYLYNSTQVHGFYFQVGVETGIIGLLIIAGIWLAFLVKAHRLYHGAKNDPDRRLLIWVLTVAALSVAIHSAVDFNLSLSALALVLFAIFGILNGLKPAGEAQAEELQGKPKKKKKKQELKIGPLVAVSVLTLVLVLGGLSLAAAGNYAFSADSALRGNNLEKGLQNLQRARKYNPFNSEYDAMLARIYQAQGKGEQAIKTAAAAAAKSKYSAARHAELASAYQSTGDFEKAVLQARKAVSLAPFQVHWYENLSRTCFVSGYMMLNDKKPEKAKPFFEQAAAVPKEIGDRMAKVTPKERELWVVAPLMDVTPSIAINTGGAL
ncbi:MAG: hypothetical protein C4570_04110, partial [Ammonifex sp.]